MTDYSEFLAALRQPEPVSSNALYPLKVQSIEETLLVTTYRIPEMISWSPKSRLQALFRRRRRARNHRRPPRRAQERR